MALFFSNSPSLEHLEFVYSCVSMLTVNALEVTSETHTASCPAPKKCGELIGMLEIFPCLTHLHISITSKY